MLDINANALLAMAAGIVLLIVAVVMYLQRREG